MLGAPSAPLQEVLHSLRTIVGVSSGSGAQDLAQQSEADHFFSAFLMMWKL